MSYSKQLVIQNGLEQADVIVVRSTGLDPFDHYLVFVGYDEWNEPVFMANMKDRGVTYLASWEVEQWIGEYYVSRIRRFQGNLKQRQKALQRAFASHGQSYSLFGQNCEHFANHVQYSRAYSQQSRIAGWSVAGLLVAGLFAAFSGGRDQDYD